MPPSGPSAAPPLVQVFHDARTCTFSYVLYDRAGGQCAIVDAVLGFDARSGRTSTEPAAPIVRFVREQGLRVTWLLETHVHADHLSAAAHLQRALGGTIGIGAGVRAVHHNFAELFVLPPAPGSGPGSPFGRLFEADEVLALGALRVRVLPVPGHTAADVAYVVEPPGDAPAIAFIGDTLFMPDVGSARCDFPGGSARTLYASARRLLALPEATRLFLCHDYPPPGRAPQCETTVGQQRRANIHLHDGIGEAEFVRLREQRDATLELPALMLPALQVNLRAGDLPPPEANGRRYLRIPLDAL